jgi:hypothetical protein
VALQSHPEPAGVAWIRRPKPGQSQLATPKTKPDLPARKFRNYRAPGGGFTRTMLATCMVWVMVRVRIE